MLVKELIRALNDLDLNAEAVVIDNNQDGWEIAGVEQGEEGAENEVWITVGERV